MLSDFPCQISETESLYAAWLCVRSHNFSGVGYRATLMNTYETGGLLFRSHPFVTSVPPLANTPDMSRGHAARGRAVPGTPQRWVSHIPAIVLRFHRWWGRPVRLVLAAGLLKASEGCIFPTLEKLEATAPTGSTSRQGGGGSRRQDSSGRRVDADQQLQRG